MTKDKLIRQYLAAIGSKGGKTRAKRHSKKEMTAWGKQGGRPRKARKP
jgi:hypothetical protein